MNRKLFDLSDLEKAATIEPPTILTSLGPVYCSLRKTLPDGSLEEFLGEPTAAFKSTSQPNLRHYVWETEKVKAELSIDKFKSEFTAVESSYLVQWRVQSKDPSLRFNCRVGFSEEPHSFSYYNNIGDQAHNGSIWTNEDFISEDSPTASVVAIARWFDRLVDGRLDHWGVNVFYLDQSQSEYPTGVFAVASGSNIREAYPEPEFAGVLRLNESQLRDFNHAVDPLG